MEGSIEFVQRVESGKIATAVVVIAAGAGGVAALSEIIPTIPASFPAGIVIVQRMRRGFTRILAQDLRDASETDIREASDGRTLYAGSVLIVPGERVAEFEKSEKLGARIRIQDVEDAEDSRSRMDTTMSSAAEVFGARAVGVVLTGMGSDSRSGLKAIRDKGGRTIAQDEISSIVYDMPKASIDAGVVDEIVPLWSVADRLIDLIGDVHGSLLQEAAG